MNNFTFRDIHSINVEGASLDNNGFSEERVRQSVLQILESSLLCSIATVTSEDDAHINTAYFSYSGKLKLYFLSHPDSLHCRNLLNNSSMAVTVFSTQQQWDGPDQGVQLFGTCEVTQGSAAEEAEQLYQRRFEDYKNWKTTLKENDIARQYRFYQFDVTEVKILDEKNLGDALFVRASILRP